MSTVGWLPAPAEELFGTEATAAESYDVLTVDVPPASWLAALTVARDRLACTYFDWLSAVDEPGTGFRVSAHVVALSPVRRLLLRTTVPHETPVLPSAVDVYAGTAWHERETHEMFGVVFEGHPALDHLLLPENFEGHPLRKDFVLAARVAKAWPGAKEPGESDHGGPKRRQMLPPGVPDPNEWGPLKGQLPPAPTRPTRAPGRATGDRPTRTTGDRPVRRTRSASEGSTSQTATDAAGSSATSQTASAGESRAAGRRPTAAGEGAAAERTSASAGASEGSMSRRHAAATDATPEGATPPSTETTAPPKAPTAPRTPDAPWHHARPAFHEPTPGDRSTPESQPTPEQPAPGDKPAAPAQAPDAARVPNRQAAPTSEDPAPEDATSEDSTSEDPASADLTPQDPEAGDADPDIPQHPAGGPQ